MNYTESEQQEVELMAEYTALYYAPRPKLTRKAESNYRGVIF